MSCCSINNIARVVDVRQLLPVDSMSAKNEQLPQFNSVVNDLASGNSARPINAQDNSAGVANNSDAVDKLVTLFTSFFTQLISLVSDKKDKAVPDISPPRPEVAPRVVPEPAAPQPAPAANIAGLSRKRNGAKPDNIWSGFRQGPDGNCVTVSAIKAAMYRFGQSPTDVFKEVKKTERGYEVIMRDGVSVNLTDRELTEGARGAKFVGRDKEMLKDAEFLFAVSAKRAQNENNDGRAARSFSAAIRSLNDGEDERGAGEGLKRLGLSKHMKRVSVRELANGQLGMCNRAQHSVAVINGREELWGRQGKAPTHGDAIALT